MSDAPAAANDAAVDEAEASSGADASVDADAEPAPDLWNVTQATTTVGGKTRAYLLSVPKNYDAGKTYPLVLVFHGDGYSGASMRGGVYFFEGASGTDAIVAYPDAQPGFSWDLYDTVPNNPDFAFVQTIINEVAASYNIDKTKVLGTGWSSGGFFVNELACNLPGIVAAIAPNSGGAPGTDQATWPLHYPNGYFKCINGQLPVPAFIVHGADDPLVAKETGEFDAMYWSYVNGCGTTTSATMPTPCIQYDGCPTTLPVVYCEIPGLPHAVWSGTAGGAWAFFKQVAP
jgi:polyhydroxybutyrate depolymerase